MEGLKEKLPILRENLQLLDTTTAQNGERNWLLFDPLQNKYFTIGEDAFKLLSIWQNECPIDEFIKISKSKDYDIDKEDLNTFINFIVNNQLVKVETYEDTKKIYEQNQKSKLSFFKWLIRNYLFIRVPLFKPDKWLNDNLFIVSFLYTKFWRNFVITLGILGVILTLRNWEEFTTTFLYLFSKEGLFYYVLSIIFVKSAHELGHAFTAKRYGAKVPTMGVAFLVLFPVLYTDTTDSWKIKSKYKRLNIVLAGMKVEIYLALIATFLWSFLPDGILKSIAFIVATTSWITSLLINISPFLRFDGYYVLSDITDSKNLQPRSFAMAKWFLRRNILGSNEEAPEYLSKNKQNFFIVYALFTWVYRFFLFLGIAFLVYYFTFKVLGIFLFIVEILWFIVIPIYKELKIWFEKRKTISFNKRNISSLIFLSLLVAFFVVPWNNKIYLPAVLESKEYVEIHTPYKSKIKKIYFNNGDYVKKGDTLLVMQSLENEFLLEQVKKEITVLKTELKKTAASKELLNSQSVLQEKLLRLQKKKEGLIQRNEALVIKASFDGIVIKNDTFNENQWVNPNEAILTLFNPNNLLLTAYCSETELKHVSEKQNGTFVFDSVNLPSLDATISEVSKVSLPYLKFQELSSEYGGEIAVKRDINNQLVTQKAYYKINAKLSEINFDYKTRQSGTLIVETEPISIINDIYTNILSILIRESGF